jgi:hypothetical protein
MNNTLESHKFFPYIAWALVIGFAVFTYFLTTNVQRELGNIGDGVERLEMRLDEMDARNAQAQ